MKVSFKVWHPVAELIGQRRRLVFEREVAPETTLGGLLTELAGENPVWAREVWCRERGMAADIFLEANGIFLRPDQVDSRRLTENDVISVRRLLHGG